MPGLVEGPKVELYLRQFSFEELLHFRLGLDHFFVVWLLFSPVAAAEALGVDFFRAVFFLFDLHANDVFLFAASDGDMDHRCVVSSSAPDLLFNVDEILRDALQFRHSLHHQLLHDLFSDHSSLQQIQRARGSSLGPLRYFDQLIGSNQQSFRLNVFYSLPWHEWFLCVRGWSTKRSCSSSYGDSSWHCDRAPLLL